MIHSFIGYALDENLRRSATSGGVGSAIVKYLFDSGKIDYALSFKYDIDKICYIPCIVDKFEDYVVCGSIYHEIPLVESVKKCLEHKKKGRIVLFSLPCQTRALRYICEKKGFKAIIIGLTCSSQQTKEATTYLLSRLGINCSNVKHLQYRGNGWPGGISIKTKDGRLYFVKNIGSIWMKIFHSRLFIQSQCFGCTNTLNSYADIVLADPWLKEYIEKETLGQTLFASYTIEGDEIVNNCVSEFYISSMPVDNNLFYTSQISTINRKKSYKLHPTVRRFMKSIFLNTTYHHIVLLSPLFFKIHCKLKELIEYFILRR